MASNLGSAQEGLYMNQLIKALPPSLGEVIRARYPKTYPFLWTFSPLQGPNLSFPSRSTSFGQGNFLRWGCVGLRKSVLRPISHLPIFQEQQMAQHQSLAGRLCPVAQYENAWSVWLQRLICMTISKLLLLSRHHFPPLLAGHFSPLGW